MMSLRRVPLSLVAILACAALAQAGGPSFIHLELSLAPDQYVALRFNITPQNDFRYSETTTYCTGSNAGARPVIGAAGWGIVDGRPHISDAAPGDSLWYINDTSDMSPQAEAQVLGRHVLTPTSQKWDYCLQDGAGPQASLRGSQDTEIFLEMGKHGSFDFSGAWTTGVNSWDVYVGNATALTLDDFASGAHASLYTVGPGVGALESYHFLPTANAVGYFDPGDTSGATMASCLHNGEKCPPGGFPGYNDVFSKGGDSWWFNVTADAETGQLQPPTYYMLALVPLPDTSYLR